MRARILLVAVVAVIAILAVPAGAAAMDIRQGDSVVIAAGETVRDDLYAFGGTVRVEGSVDGDVVAFGGDISVNGSVSGDVIAAGGMVRISGDVGGTVRASGGQVVVSGTVEDDLVLAGGSVSVESESTVGRDIAVGAGQLELAGEVDRNVRVAAGQVRFAGSVGGNVEAEADTVIVAQSATIQGDLDYWSDNDADVSGRVSGDVTRHEPRVQRGRRPGYGFGIGGLALGILGWIRSLIGMALLGLLFVLPFAGYSSRSARAWLARPWVSLGIGALVLFFTPWVAVVAFVIGVLIGGWWLAFFLMVFYVLAILLAMIVTSTALGRAGLARISGREVAPVWGMLVGLLALWIVGVIPFIGWLISLAAILFGLGALTLAALGKQEPPAGPSMRAGAPGQPAAPPTPQAPERPAAPEAPPLPERPEPPGAPSPTSGESGPPTSTPPGA